MHWLLVVPVCMQPQATDSAMLTSVVYGVMRVTALSLSGALHFFYKTFASI